MLYCNTTHLVSQQFLFFVRRLGYRSKTGNVHPTYKDDEHHDEERPTLIDDGLSTWDHNEGTERKVSSQSAVKNMAIRWV